MATREITPTLFCTWIRDTSLFTKTINLYVIMSRVYEAWLRIRCIHFIHVCIIKGNIHWIIWGLSRDGVDTTSNPSDYDSYLDGPSSIFKGVDEGLVCMCVYVCIMAYIASWGPLLEMVNLMNLITLLFMRMYGLRLSLELLYQKRIWGMKKFKVWKSHHWVLCVQFDEPCTDKLNFDGMYWKRPFSLLCDIWISIHFRHGVYIQLASCFSDL